MAWYNPLSWFKKPDTIGYNALRCYSPQCGRQIDDDQVEYNADKHEIYHIGDCALVASCYRARSTGKPEVSNTEFIDREDAIQLLFKGKLRETTHVPNLEERIE